MLVNDTDRHHLITYLYKKQNYKEKKKIILKFIHKLVSSIWQSFLVLNIIFLEL